MSSLSQCKDILPVFRLFYTDTLWVSLNVPHAAGMGERALHSAYPPPSWLWNPWLCSPQPSCPQTQSPHLFHLSLDHLPACRYLFPNSMTPFWRRRTTPVVAPGTRTMAHHRVSVAAKWLPLSCSQWHASWCPRFAWYFWLLLHTELMILNINLKLIHPVKLDQSSLNTSIHFFLSALIACSR